MKVSILESKFKRSKLNLNYTKLWKTLDIPSQNIIFQNINLSNNEIPIVTLFVNNIDWWLISDQKIYNHNNFLEIINLNDIIKIEISKNIKFLEENFISIYYNDKKTLLKLEQRSWSIMSDILIHLTHLNLSIDKFD